MAAVGGAGVTGAVVLSEYQHSQQHTMGSPHSGTTTDHFVLVVHNWGAIEYRAFASEAEAITAFHGGLRLRRFVARMHTADETDVDNGHGWLLPWEELAFDGCGWHLDNEMRRGLLNYRANVWELHE